MAHKTMEWGWWGWKETLSGTEPFLSFQHNPGWGLERPQTLWNELLLPLTYSILLFYSFEMCHTYRWVNKTWKYMLKNNNVVRCTWLATRSRKKIGALPQLWFHLHSAAKSLQSCPTLCDPIDGSPPGSPVPGILQARTLEWVAISFSNARKWKVKVKSLSCAWLFETPWTAAYQAPPSMGFSSQEYWSGVPWLVQK